MVKLPRVTCESGLCTQNTKTFFVFTHCNLIKLERRTTMSMNRFVEAIGKPLRIKLRWREENIPGTNKIRTFTANPRVYSKESDLENIITNKQKNKKTF